MKTIKVIVLLIFMLNCVGYSQEENSIKNIEQTSQHESVQSKKVTKSDYSKQNLQLASIEDLNHYLKKAKGIKTTGLVTTIAGSVIFLGGAAMTASWIESGIPVFYTGALVTTIGVPILITGSQRVNKVKRSIDARAFQNLSISDKAEYNNKQVQDDLNHSLKKAHNLKTTGMVMTIAGPVFMVTGIALDSPVFLAGVATTAVGIPLLVSGSKKIKRIENGLNTHNKTSLSVAPGFVFANQNKNPTPGISFKFTF